MVIGGFLLITLLITFSFFGCIYKTFLYFCGVIKSNNQSLKIKDMEITFERKVKINVCNDCPHFKEVADYFVCADSFDEPNYDWYCTNKDANNKGTSLEKYNNRNGVSIGGSYHRNGVCGIPNWCPLKKREEIEHKEGVYYIENTIDEYRTKITCFCKTLDDARNCIKECSDWFRPNGTGAILFKPFGVNQESVEIERY